MKERIFTDKNGEQLIIQHRKSAVFILKKYKDGDLEKHRSGEIYIDGAGLYGNYEFAKDMFNELYQYLVKAGAESWKDINPRVADSMGADCDDYYDRDFDNNGSLSIGDNSIRIEGPYAQPPNKDNLTRLIKFNKRKFESFIYDFRNALGVSK